MKLELEELESRNCLAPTFLNFTVTQGNGATVWLSGIIQDPAPGNPANLTVTFNGAVNAVSPPTASDGSFYFPAQASSPGVVNATVTDNMWAQGLGQTTLLNNAPRIDTFSVVHSVGDTYVVSGHVTDEAPAGQLVYFGGIPSLQGRAATVDPNGNFFLSVELQSGERGTATADFTDQWGAWAPQRVFAVANVW